MPDPSPIADSVALDATLATAERLLGHILETARQLSPEGWENAWSHALLNRGWHTMDVALLKDVRLISMRGGPRYRPPRVPQYDG